MTVCTLSTGLQLQSTSLLGDIARVTLQIVAERDSDSIVVKLCESDIPGAALKGPLERHTIPELKRWLLCRDVTVPSSLKKSQHIDRYVVCIECKIAMKDTVPLNFYAE